jgi:hypothetical protein
VPGISEVCRRQAAVVTRQQALGSGMTVEQIRNKLHSGRWQRLCPGVYATFSGELPREARLWAAVLAAGPGATLSHQTAAALVSGRIGQARHPTRLPPQTRVEETVLDLTQTARDLDSALSWITRACAARLTTVERLRTALAQRKKVRWRAELCATLDDVGLGSHSLLELRYLRNVERRHALPRGVPQRPRLRPGGRWYDDVSYEEYATVVELDGRAAHPEHAKWRDRRRDNA